MRTNPFAHLQPYHLTAAAIKAYVNGTLTQKEEQQLLQHAAICPLCNECIEFALDNELLEQEAPWENVNIDFLLHDTTTEKITVTADNNTSIKRTALNKDLKHKYLSLLADEEKAFTPNMDIEAQLTEKMTYRSAAFRFLNKTDSFLKVIEPTNTSVYNKTLRVEIEYPKDKSVSFWIDDAFENQVSPKVVLDNEHIVYLDIEKLPPGKYYWRAKLNFTNRSEAMWEIGTFVKPINT